MSTLGTAREFERQDALVEAAEAYEAAYEAEGGLFSLDDCLDVAVLYFVCADFGYCTFKNLPDVFAASAYARARSWLQEARRRFGEHPEVRFWELYIDFVVLGEDSFDEECAKLLDTGRTIIPYFYMYSPMEEERQKYLGGARMLYDAVREGCTAKQRYIRSVLDGMFRLVRRRRVP